MIAALILSLLGTGFSLYGQINANQTAKADGQQAIDQVTAQNALLSIQSDAAYLGALSEQSQTAQLAAAQEAENAKRQQLITAIAIGLLIAAVLSAMILLIRSHSNRS